MKKLILFSSQGISVKLVEYFSSRTDIEVMFITQVTKKDTLYDYSSPIEYCQNNNIKFYCITKFDANFTNKVRQFKPDILLTAYYPRILPEELLKIPKIGSFNVHPGSLPEYRGPYSIPNSILNGEIKIKATLHELTAHIDAGDIIAQSSINIDNKMTAHELYLKGMLKCADLVKSSFDDLLTGKFSKAAQVGYGSYYNYFERSFHINWQTPVVSLMRRVRVHSYPYLPAYFFINNYCVYVKSIKVNDYAHTSAQKPGRIIEIQGAKTICVSCADAIVEILEYDIYPSLDEKKFDLVFYPGAILD